jgi:Putative zincin peptidase
MRFCIGIPRPNDAFQPERDGWTRFREPTMLVFWLYALPVSALTFVGLMVAIGSVGDTSARIVINTRDATVWQVVLVVFLAVLAFFSVLVIHELVHLLMHPQQGRSRDSIVGVWPRAFVFYSSFDNEISRNRFLVMVASPFLLLSVCPVLLFWITGKVLLSLVFVALVNGIGSSFDLLVIGMVLAQVPSNALIRNKGWITYWKPRGNL